MRKLIVLAYTTFLGLLWASPVQAGSTDTGGSLPWNEPLEILHENISGPTANALILIGITIGAIVWAATDNNRGLQWIGKGLVALAIVVKLADLINGLGINAALL